MPPFAKISKKGVLMADQNWYRLDTAAKIYPSISQTHNNTTFRLGLELTEPVQKEILQEALVRIACRVFQALR